MTSYRHTQFAKAIFWPVLACAIVTCVAAVLSPAMRLAAVPAVSLALVAWLFSSLTITVDERAVRAVFGPGLVRKRVPLAAIEDCQPVRTRWWEGWGIHLSRFGWLYNVSGWDAVAIRLRNGKQVALGTDQPNELAEAIRCFASAR